MRTHHASASGRSRTLHRAAAAAPKSHRLHGQQVIESGRVSEIQQALIREHYFSGEANGRWDATTEAAMQKYQADQGWQTRLMPDSRAIKKLGLGPDYSGAINAKNSSFADPPASRTIPVPQSEGFASAAGVSR
jgi:peptidoglycan hydrolase-like protein with peptidoglycan-binding domain